MNEQAMRLRQMAEQFSPSCPPVAQRWLIHGCVEGVGVETVYQNIRAVLQAPRWTGACDRQLGFETRPRWANSRDHRQSGSVVQISRSGELQIDVARLPSLPCASHTILIFVLDANPLTLLKTYAEMKKLLDPACDWRMRIAVLLNHTLPGAGVGEGQIQQNAQQTTERLIAHYMNCCQRFNAWQPFYLGSLPYTAQLEPKTCADVPSQRPAAWMGNQPASPWSRSLQRIVRRAWSFSQAAASE